MIATAAIPPHSPLASVAKITFSHADEGIVVAMNPHDENGVPAVDFLAGVARADAPDSGQMVVQGSTTGTTTVGSSVEGTPVSTRAGFDAALRDAMRALQQAPGRDVAASSFDAAEGASEVLRSIGAKDVLVQVAVDGDVLTKVVDGTADHDALMGALQRAVATNH